MKPELYLEKLSTVCDWTLEPVKGETGSSGRAGESDERTLELVIKSFHPKPCDRVPGQFNCRQKVFWKEAKNNNKSFGVMVRVTQCMTCGGLITPKGNYIEKPNSFNYAFLCHQRDQED